MPRFAFFLLVQHPGSVAAAAADQPAVGRREDMFTVSPRVWIGFACPESGSDAPRQGAPCAECLLAWVLSCRSFLMPVWLGCPSGNHIFFFPLSHSSRAVLRWCWCWCWCWRRARRCTIHLHCRWSLSCLSLLPSSAVCSMHSDHQRPSLGLLGSLARLCRARQLVLLGAVLTDLPLVPLAAFRRASAQFAAAARICNVVYGRFNNRFITPSLSKLNQ
ncbi:uncharacterized protein BJ171DRAFT_120611 [Polychytrium aggregatum]|uniref:uncharacterized protein n=1 Tax=Polychytrium aggregatum TaxID=110093 RepID=UPI0022FEA3D7|nr:uncharacterized protein BJ171DRAFT_120611 [Polychytrium aggregatum]KAI9204194.1 hypothetical protein BJ171DRAFT_120611 [Polychytrium aggregatum]